MTELDIHKKIKKKIDLYVKTKRIPHIIFHGPAGCGKRYILTYLLSQIYKEAKEKKKYIIYINCAHGKGIRFIRNELKFFAKTNIQNNDGKLFKSIILFNADKLTTDAQSALRRCIEQFSHTTRFFIIVENQNKLLRPILSRFCNIHIPLPTINDKLISLHKYKKTHLQSQNQRYISKRCNWLKTNIQKKTNYSKQKKCIQFCRKLYEKGYSCLDLMTVLEKNDSIDIERKYLLLIYFDKVRKEFRNEKILMFYLINFAFIRANIDLENIIEM